MSGELRAAEHARREEEVEGWQVGITSYRLGEVWHCTVDNVSPGANVARARGASRAAAEAEALAKARERLARTRVQPEI